MEDKLIMDVVGEIAAEQLPKLAAKALGRLAKTDEVKDNPVTGIVVSLAQKWVKTEGPKATGKLLGDLDRVLAGDSAAFLAMAKNMDAAALTVLTDAYQTAEAKQQRAARDATVKMGRHLYRFGRVLSRAVLAAAGAE